MVGFINEDEDCFHETLNTLEFIEKSVSMFSSGSNQKANLSNILREDMLNATPESLRQVLHAYSRVVKIDSTLSLDGNKMRRSSNLFSDSETEIP